MCLSVVSVGINSVTALLVNRALVIHLPDAVMPARQSRFFVFCCTLCIVVVCLHCINKARYCSYFVLVQHRLSRQSDGYIDDGGGAN